jgi:hypothetical protein
MPRKFPIISSDEFTRILIKRFGCWWDRENKHPTIKRKRGAGEIGVSVPKRKELGVGVLGDMLEDLGITDEEFIKAYRER